MHGLTSRVFSLVITVAITILLYNLLFTGFNRATTAASLGNNSPLAYSAQTLAGQVRGLAPRGGLLEIVGKGFALTSCVAYEDYGTYIQENITLDCGSSTINPISDFDATNGYLVLSPSEIPVSPYY